VSRIVEETYEVYSEKVRKARKPHQCDACETTIRRGDLYCVASWVFDGSASSVKRCGRCQMLHRHIRDIADGDVWPDEELNCGLRYQDEWGPVPAEIEALPLLTDDEASKLLRGGP
jgi:hypothetical protein